MHRQSWIIIGIFVLLTIVFTLPTVFFLTDKVIGDPGDTYQFLGFQYLAKEEFFRGNFPFGWSNYWRYPYGVIVPNVVDATLFIILGLALYQFMSNPVVVYNLSILILLFLNGFLTYKAFRYRFSPLVSLASSIIYGFSFYSLSKLGGHFNLVFTAGFAGFVFSMLHFLDTHGSRRSYFYLSSSTLAIAFASLQYPLMFMGVLPFVGAACFWFYREKTLLFFQLLWKQRMQVVVSGVGILGVFMLFHGTKLIDLFEGDVIFPTFEVVNTPFINFLIPNGYIKTISAVVHNDTREWIENVVFAGYIEILLFYTALVILPKTRIYYFLVSITAILLIISIGTQPFLEPLWPYQYLFELFPYRGIIEPGRFVAVTYLFMTIVIALYLQRMKNKRTIIVIILLLVVSRLPWGFHLSSNLYNKPFIDSVRSLKSRAVLDVPVRTDWWNGQYYDMYSIYYQKPITNAYFHWSGNTEEAQTLTKFMEPLSCYLHLEFAEEYNPAEAYVFREELIRKMLFYDIRILVIHQNYAYYEENCSRTRQYMDVILELEDAWQLVYEDENKIVYWLTYD